MLYVRTVLEGRWGSQHTAGQLAPRHTLALALPCTSREMGAESPA